MQCMEEVFILTMVVLCFAALLAFVFQSVGIYVGFSVIVGGALGLYLCMLKLNRGQVSTVLSVFAIFCGVIYSLLLCLIAWRRSVSNRKQRRAEIARSVQYTLPQRENSYVRSRLQTTLCRMQGESMSQSVQLSYARELLVKIKAMPLSIGERLQVEEMGKILTLYNGKEFWTVNELNHLNDLCSALLKLSAKYEV